MTHLKSEHFKVLRGAMSLLSEPYEMMFHTVFHPEGMEEVMDKCFLWIPEPGYGEEVKRYKRESVRGCLRASKSRLK